MKKNEEGRKLTIDILKELGFKKEIIHDYDGDEIKFWYKDGITIYEDSWWIKDGKSIYEPGEKEPEITFAFATYVKGDGRFKSGFSVGTDEHVKNIVYALTSKLI